MLRLLEGQLITELERVANLRAPVEAVGLILPDDTVVELPNRSLTPHNRFEVFGADVRITLEMNGVPLSQEGLQNCTLWHSHPSGGVGPSRTDMKNTVSVMSHLVISLAEDGSWTPSWY